MHFPLILCLVALAFGDSSEPLRRIKRVTANSSNIDQDFVVVTEDCKETTSTAKSRVGNMYANKANWNPAINAVTQAPKVIVLPLKPPTTVKTSDCGVLNSATLAPVITPNPMGLVVESPALAGGGAAVEATESVVKVQPPRAFAAGDNDKHSMHLMGKNGSGRRRENGKKKHERTKMSKEGMYTKNIRDRLMKAFAKNNVNNKVALEGDDGNKNNNRISNNKQSVSNVSDFANGNGMGNAKAKANGIDNGNANIKFYNNNNNVNNPNNAGIKNRHNKQHPIEDNEKFYSSGVFGMPLIGMEKSRYEQEVQRERELERQQELLQQKPFEGREEQQGTIDIALGKYPASDGVLQLLLYKLDGNPLRAQGTQFSINSNPFANMPNPDADFDFDTIDYLYNTFDQSPGMGPGGIALVPPSIRSMGNNYPLQRPYNFYQSDFMAPQPPLQPQGPPLNFIENALDLLVAKGMAMAAEEPDDTFMCPLHREFKKKSLDSEMQCSIDGGENGNALVCSCRVVKKKH